MRLYPCNLGERRQVFKITRILMFVSVLCLYFVNSNATATNTISQRTLRHEWSGEVSTSPK